MSRQYLNVNFIPTAMFSKNTEGLCGFMDDDDTNDLIGPNGEQHNDTTQFAESCMYARSVLSFLFLALQINVFNLGRRINVFNTKP